MNVADLSAAGAPLWLVVVLLLIVAIGGGIGIEKLLTARATKRKIDAEGDKSEAERDKVNADASVTLVTAATQLVAPLERRIAATESTVVEQGKEIKVLREDLHLRDTLAAEHAGWDYIAEEKAKEAGIVLPPRPPLRPPAA